MRAALVLILLLLVSCSSVQYTPEGDHLQPDVVTKQGVPLYFKSRDLLYKTVEIVRYIDAVQFFLQLHEPHVSRSRVVVYPKGGLFHRKRWDRLPGEVQWVKVYGSREIKVEWHNRRGAWSYAEVRLRQAGWSENLVTKRNEFVRRACEQGEHAIGYFGDHRK